MDTIVLRQNCDTTVECRTTATIYGAKTIAVIIAVCLFE